MQKITQRWKYYIKRESTKLDREKHQHHYSGNENRQDMAVFNYDLNVAMDIISPRYFKSCSFRRRLAASRRKERKMIKYENNNLPGNTSSLNFTLLVFEHFGTWRSKATNYLNKLGRRSRDIEGYTNKATLAVLGEKFSIMLQRCNAKVILHKLTRV